MPIYEYECDACGPFAESRPMAASALPAPCPRCAAPAPRVLSPTASIGAGRQGRGVRRRRGGAAEPSVVAVPERREPSRRRREVDPLRAARPGHATDRPWMVGH
ncbi:MAG TPA: zinc ribbon domain-containing protein [Polyangia bacterium]